MILDKTLLRRPALTSARSVGEARQRLVRPLVQPADSQVRYPAALTTQHALHLQRVAGNRALAPRLNPTRHPATLTIQRTITQDVNDALKDVAGEDLSKELILKKLTEKFGADLHQKTREPEFAKALLEAIRSKQGAKWQAATATTQAKKPRNPINDNAAAHWNVRHYTNKFYAVLGDEVSPGVYQVKDVEPPPFTELLSSITLATMTPSADRPADKVMGTYSAGAATSGHTTSKDWKNIGNVGDTFYGLFYDDKPATGVTPAFIKDAVYYAQWPASEFGDAWASADWLSYASMSQKPDPQLPDLKGYEGNIVDIIAQIYPLGLRSTSDEEIQRKQAFGQMTNFEVKKHGPMTVNEWKPVAETINTIKGWRITKDGKKSS
ncbi:MAG TPA: hypothetical protein VKV06_00750 [Acidimicrobiales bacterium]|nr:hypothetical protein [Acidimicrobiales bacterium]